MGKSDGLRASELTQRQKEALYWQFYMGDDGNPYPSSPMLDEVSDSEWEGMAATFAGSMLLMVLVTHTEDLALHAFVRHFGRGR